MQSKTNTTTTTPTPFGNMPTPASGSTATPRAPIGNSQSPAPIFYFTGNRNVVHIHSHHQNDENRGGSVAGLTELMSERIPPNLRFANAPFITDTPATPMNSPNATLFAARSIQQQRYSDYQQNAKAENEDSTVPGNR